MGQVTTVGNRPNSAINIYFIYTNYYIVNTLQINLYLSQDYIHVKKETKSHWITYC